MTLFFFFFGWALKVLGLSSWAPQTFVSHEREREREKNGVWWEIYYNGRVHFSRSFCAVCLHRFVLPYRLFEFFLCISFVLFLERRREEEGNDVWVVTSVCPLPPLSRTHLTSPSAAVHFSAPIFFSCFMYKWSWVRVNDLTKEKIRSDTAGCCRHVDGQTAEKEIFSIIWPCLISSFVVQRAERSLWALHF